MTKVHKSLALLHSKIFAPSEFTKTEFHGGVNPKKKILGVDSLNVKFTFTQISKDTKLRYVLCLLVLISMQKKNS